MKQIPLTKGMFALVDDADFEWLMQWKWFASKGTTTYYAHRNSQTNHRRKTLQMHSLIMDTPQGMETDHIDGNGLNNQRLNLRVCTKAQNQHNMRVPSHNTSGFKGVDFHRVTGKWRSRISVNKESKTIGYFSTPQDAARSYDEAAQQLFGEFAKLNFTTK